MLCRVAGDEFVCLLKDHSPEAAIELCEQIRTEIQRSALEVRPGQYARIGLSFGVAVCPDDGQSIDDLLHAAAAATHQQTDLGQSQSIGPSVVHRLPAKKTGTGPLALI